MYKLIAVDLDDTLLTPDLQISPRTLEAVKKAKEKGVIFTVATGRMYVSARKYIKQMGITDEVIVYNGSIVVDPETDEFIISKTVPLELAKEVLDIAKENNIYVQIYMDDKCYTAEDSDKRQVYLRHTGVEPEVVGDLKIFMKTGPTKLLYVGEPEQIKRLYKSLGEHFAGKLELTVSKPEYLEFVDKSVSKGEALKELAEKLGIAREEVMAFGDSYNDVAMLEYAHMGVAMGNAFDAVKERANLVAPANYEDGVACVLEKYVLMEEDDA